MMVRKRIDRKDKKLHREFVWLAPNEYAHLCELLGKDAAEGWIDDLNLYIGSKGDPYESHYYTILVWARKKAKAVNKPKDDGRGTNDASAQRDTDRFIEALKSNAYMSELAPHIRAAVLGVLQKCKVKNWPLLRQRLLDDPTIEKQIREEFIAEAANHEKQKS